MMHTDWDKRSTVVSVDSRGRRPSGRSWDCPIRCTFCAYRRTVEGNRLTDRYDTHFFWIYNTGFPIEKHCHFVRGQSRIRWNLRKGSCCQQVFLKLQCGQCVYRGRLNLEWTVTPLPLITIFGSAYGTRMLRPLPVNCIPMSLVCPTLKCCREYRMEDLMQCHRSWRSPPRKRSLVARLPASAGLNKLTSSSSPYTMYQVSPRVSQWQLTHILSAVFPGGWKNRNSS